MPNCQELYGMLRNNESFLRTLHDLHPSFIHWFVLKHLFYGSEIANRINIINVDVGNGRGKGSMKEYNHPQEKKCAWQLSSLQQPAFGSRREIIVTKIVDFRINPDQMADTTIQIWNKANK
uniref:Uncharacterized protein n=1 Tax=Romanomermis culicivorax TaxID=13658 RepID=A0A915KI82_ROMCU